MHSEPDSPDSGPVFVDSSGRRARLLRRAGLALGALCLGYVALLGLAFMGVGIPLTSSDLLPFGSSEAGGGGPGAGTGAGTGAGPGDGPAPVGTAAPSDAPTPPAAAVAE
jgi:hypothetical protein